MIRYYTCPIETVAHPSGSGATFQRPRAAGYTHNAWVAVYHPSKPFALVYMDADDFAAIDADGNCKSVLEDETDVLPAGQRNPQGVRAWLAGKTWGDLSSQKRTRISNVLTGLGVSMAGVTNATTLYTILDMVLKSIEPSGGLDQVGARRSS